MKNADTTGAKQRSALDDPRCRQAVDAILANDESSTDEQLVAHFLTFGLTDEAARAEVGRRD